jgi:toxin YhaV
MLESGHPPDDWDQLLTQARAEGHRLRQFVGAVAPQSEGPVA